MADQYTNLNNRRFRNVVAKSNLTEVEDYPEGAVPRFFGPTELWVEGINMLKAQNELEHRTFRYRTDKLVVRRGQTFRLIVTFSQDVSSDDIQLEFLIGANPNPMDNSRVIVSFGWHSYNRSSWKGQPMQQFGSTLELVVFPSPRAVVGKYRCYVVVNAGSGLVRSRRNHKTDIYMLFNPWCPEDCAYYPVKNQHELQEYVLNDSGLIFQGTADYPSSCKWYYGQFDNGILDACIYILDAAQMPIRKRADLLSVIRKASAMLNAQDDAGVMVGNWSQSYDYGTNPSTWAGSTKILLEYANTGNPVRYAQCWVFAGVFTTFMRCLGVASRTVTNFDSAHDNTGNLRVDLIYLANGRPDHFNTRDSMWNYHCWNEVYMGRVDLPSIYSGWQAVDATPQETSDGMYRCGPASVKAIKTGQICYGFDSGFILAEVNSDVVYQRYEDGEYKVFKVDTNYVGKLICTKAVGSNNLMDLTHEYKYPEGTKQNQEALNTAEAFGMARDHTVIEDEEHLRVSIMIQEVFFGEAIPLTVTIRNLTTVNREFHGGLDVAKEYYTGVTEPLLHHEDINTQVNANEVWQTVFSLSREIYSRQDNGDTHTLQVTVSGEVDSQLVTETKLIEIKLKAPVVLVSGDLHVSGVVTVMVSFTNDTGDVLSDVDMAVTGTDIIHSIVLHFDSVDVNELISQKVQITLEHTGHYTFIGKVILHAVYESSESHEFDVNS